MLYTTSPAQDGRPEADKLLLDYARRGIAASDVLDLPHPGGVSGGPIWSIPILERNDKQLWTLDKFRLVSIVTHYLPSSHRLQGVPIQHWLQLVLGDHPELSEHIAPLLKN